jgi:hypothetical protein
MWFESTGKIVYDPPRGDMKRRTKWWCVLEVDNNIANYYRWWVEKQYIISGNGDVKRFITPPWRAHVSIIRGEKPEDHLKHLWKKYQGKIVSFRYKHYPYQARKKGTWCIEVESPFLMNIREELNRPTHWPLHLTVVKQQF